MPLDTVLFYEGKIPSKNKYLAPFICYKNIKGKKIAYPAMRLKNSYRKAIKEIAHSFCLQTGRKNINDDFPDTYNEYVDITYYFTAPKSYDSDNFLKCIGDALQAAKIVKNDNRIRNFSVVRYYGNKNEIFIYIRNADTINEEKPY